MRPPKNCGLCPKLMPGIVKERIPAECAFSGPIKDELMHLRVIMDPWRKPPPEWCPLREE